MRCNCGKDGRYTRIKDGDISEMSCDKYFSCKPYDQLEARIDTIEAAIRAWSKETMAANVTAGTELEHSRMCIDANKKLMGVLDE